MGRFLPAYPLNQLFREKGCIIQVGNHEQLKKKKGFYADLIKLQQDQWPVQSQVNAWR